MQLLISFSSNAYVILMLPKFQKQKILMKLPQVVVKKYAKCKWIAGTSVGEPAISSNEIKMTHLFMPL